MRASIRIRDESTEYESKTVIEVTSPLFQDDPTGPIIWAQGVDSTRIVGEPYSLAQLLTAIGQTLPERDVYYIIRHENDRQDDSCEHHTYRIVCVRS